MALNTWKKCENEAGFPYYIRDESCVKQWDHPAFADILSRMNQACDIRYAVYRMAYKIMSLQENLQVPTVRIISGVFAHHCLSLSESSFVLEPCELEAILTDIYFAANKEGTFDGDIDASTEIALNFLLNVYDRERTSSISVQSAKAGLALVSGSPRNEAWAFLLGSVADHNGCVRPRRLAALLGHVGQVAEFLGEGTTYGRHAVQQEVDKCFAKTPGMLGLSEHGLLEWLEAGPTLLNWTEVRERLRVLKSSGLVDHQLSPWKCALCSVRNPTGLKFKCTRCWGMMLCERCYLYNDVKPASANIIHRHKKSHSVKEIIDSQAMPSRCMVGFVRNIKKILSCPSNCRRMGNPPSNITYPLQTHPSGKENTVPGDVTGNEQLGIEKANNRNVFTSTVGKASGKMISDPKMVLQDIIAQLESQNKALKNLSNVLSDVQQVNSMDRRIQHKVDNHWGQIAVQINRLKMFKSIFQENLPDQESFLQPGLDKTLPQQQHMRMDAFEVFSPIPAMAKESTVMEHKHIASAAEGDTKAPIVHYYDDSISKVSMGDISTWFANVTDADKAAKDPQSLPSQDFQGAPHGNGGPSNSAPGPSTSEDKFNADLESVATSNSKMKELNADLDSVLDRLQSILANNFSLDETNFDNTQLKETANEMEGLLGTLIRGVEQRRTIKGDKI